MYADEIAEKLKLDIVAAKLMGYETIVYRSLFILARENKDRIGVSFDERDDTFLVADYRMMETHTVDTIEEVKEMLINLL